jgi:hypothetical protein
VKKQNIHKLEAIIGLLRKQALYKKIFNLNELEEGYQESPLTY